MGFNSWYGQGSLEKPHLVMWRKTVMRWEEFDFSPLSPTGEISINAGALGEEGEEGYIPDTTKNPYATSLWYTYIRPKFITLLEDIFGADNLVSFKITVLKGCINHTAGLNSLYHLSEDILKFILLD